MEPRTEPRRFTLPGGRVLGYDEHGPPDGTPLLYFHGVPSSRLDFRMFGSDALADRLGIRVIAVDRPGCGRSDFQPGRRMSEWPVDVAALADHLELDRFAVLGWSGGGPYALACARALSDRVAAAGIVSGMGPHDVPTLTEGIGAQSMKFFRLNRERPSLGRLFDRLMALGVRRDPDRFLARSLAALPAADQDALAAPNVARGYVDAVRECFRMGTRGAQVDTSLMVSPWDFDPRDIRTPVWLWHGERDTDAPPAMGRWLAAAVPGCRAKFFADEGHVSLIVNHAEAILRALISRNETG